MIKKRISKILVPLDGSKNSIRGLETAITLARSCGATITGIYSSLKLNLNQKNVLIKEDIPKDAGDSSDWDLDRDKYGSKIRIKPL